MLEIIFFALALISEIIGTVLGFGSSTIFLPLALFFLDFKTALILVAFFHFFGNIGRVTFFRKNINKRLLLIFGLPSILLTIIGALLVNYLNQDILKLILGLFILSFSIVSLIKPDIKLKATKANSVIGGSLSGFFAGLIGAGGALRSAFLTAFNIKKQLT